MLKYITKFILVFLILNPSVTSLDKDKAYLDFDNFKNENDNEMKMFDMANLDNDLCKTILLKNKIDQGLLDYINEEGNYNKDTNTQTHYYDLKRILEADNYVKRNSIPSKHIGLGKKNYIPIKYIGLGKRSSIPSKFIGLGKRDSIPTKYIGLGKRDSIPSKYIGLGKRDSIPSKYIGLGKKNYIPSRYIGLGKRNTQEVDDIKLDTRKSKEMEKKEIGNNNFRLIGLGKRFLNGDNIEDIQNEIIFSRIKGNDKKVSPIFGNSKRNKIKIISKDGIKFLPSSFDREKMKFVGKNNLVRKISHTLINHNNDMDKIMINIRYMDI